MKVVSPKASSKIYKIFTIVTAVLAVLFLTSNSWIASLTYKSKSILTTERVTIFNAENNHHVYAEYGDLFANNGSSKNVVITANRCFDTIVDNDLISETTIHGLAINKICTNGYTPEMLNDALQKNLSDRHINASLRFVNTRQTKRKSESLPCWNYCRIQKK